MPGFFCQESIADILGVPQQTIADIVKITEKRQLSDFGKDFKPNLYNNKRIIDSMQKRQLSEMHKDFKPSLYNHSNKTSPMTCSPHAREG